MTGGFGHDAVDWPGFQVCAIGLRQLAKMGCIGRDGVAGHDGSLHLMEFHLAFLSYVATLVVPFWYAILVPHHRYIGHVMEFQLEFL